MEKINNKYQRGKIYKIVCNTTGLCYVGSTIESTLSNRLTKHRCDYKRYIDGKYHYVSSYEVLENNNYYIELICAAPCNNRDELHQIEGKYQKEIKCVNWKVAGRKKEEYYDIEEHSEKRVNQRKKYYEANKTNILLKQKQYGKDNSSKISKRNKTYRETHAEQIKAHASEKIQCECGGVHDRHHKARHAKTKRHIKYLETK